jgi:phosphoribosylglycinamide formyltransferase 1
MGDTMLNIGVLASTSATDLQAVIDAIKSKKLNVKISILISDKKDAFALERAKANGIDSEFLDPKNFSVEKDGKKDKEKSREKFDEAVMEILGHKKTDIILLIGYMRFLSRKFVEKYENKIMNIHPSLLPKYAGGMDRNVHEEVLRNKEKTTGATLHFVDEGADTGPIIMQKEVAIAKNETADSLKQKVQKAEQEIIVKSLNLYEKGKVKVINGKVVIKD